DRCYRFSFAALPSSNPGTGRDDAIAPAIVARIISWVAWFAFTISLRKDSTAAPVCRCWPEFSTRSMGSQPMRLFKAEALAIGVQRDGKGGHVALIRAAERHRRQLVYGDYGMVLCQWISR